jgi:hypothetical protein
MTLHCCVVTTVIVAVGVGRHHVSEAGRRRGVEALILIDNPLGDDAVHRLLFVRGQIWGQELFTRAEGEVWADRWAEGEGKGGVKGLSSRGGRGFCRVKDSIEPKAQCAPRGGVKGLALL